ncbi:MAG: hypothetical protein NC390_04055 [Fusobacterium sp.]|nr:hypothetical protein [Fusobacterium sp.]
MYQNYNYNQAFLYPKQPTSAREVREMAKQRNPIIETDKNIEKCLVEGKYQTQLLNDTQKIINENAEIVKQLSLQIKSIEDSSNKQYKTALIISIITGLFAAGSFVLALIQVYM